MVKIFAAMKMLNSLLVQNCNIYQKMWQKLFVGVCVYARMHAQFHPFILFCIVFKCLVTLIPSLPVKMCQYGVH
jgi:hypothetical protein